MALRERQRWRNAPIALMPGDTLIATIKDVDGTDLVRRVDAIGRCLMVNVIVMADVVDELGVADGIAVLIGKEST